MKYFLRILWLLLSFYSCIQAVDFHLSGFGTLGGTISDKEYDYLRFINNDGTLKSNTLVGTQADITLNNQWKATIQGKFSPAINSEQDWDATLPWAFVSYRPSNDWLIRIGKMRIPLYLHSQNMNVGVTYDMTRLPYEVYSLSSVDDGIGISVIKSFSFESGELFIDMFYTESDYPYRFYMRDDLTALGGFPKGVNFFDMEVKTAGIVLQYETYEGDRFRAGVNKSKLNFTGATGGGGTFSLQASPTDPLNPLSAYPFPFYQPNGDLDKNEVIVFTMGADYGFGDNYRITSEYAFRNLIGADTGPKAHSAYIALSKSIGKWTPYVSISALKTSSNVMDLYNNLNNDPINSVIPINRQYADYTVASEQTSVALGFSYAFSPTQKLKAEWTRSRIGEASNFLIDNPTIEPITHESINVFSLSYSMSF